MNKDKAWTELIRRNQSSGEVKVNHVYAAKLIDVDEDPYDSNKFKFTYQVTNENGEILHTHRRIEKANPDWWLKNHTGYDENEQNPLAKISTKYHLILVSEYNGHTFVRMIKPIENMVINNEEY